eukprot:CAMPEP_0115120426 /NCGR_PEP_ID=MMETSP0227-20121206/45678_1 /TAXON_ID=89957 /ORGANISM="Polarella glacialis, Strain CCMP 1383" /LENGTH=410 /DNA_ID=CAMNT_0002522081 /DNA_START=47 /DNA_END=1279 /DNA_ORIENTATION=-
MSALANQPSSGCGEFFTDAGGWLQEHELSLGRSSRVGAMGKRALADITNHSESPRRKAPFAEAAMCTGPSSFKQEPHRAGGLEPTGYATRWGGPGLSDSDHLCQLDSRILDDLRCLELPDSVAVALGQCLHSQVPSEGAYEYQEPGEADDPQRVSEYVFDIFSKLDRDEEKFALPRPDYMKDQPELCEEERSIAIDWLVEVQGKYKLRTETLFLAVGLFDRFLSTKKVRRDDLQLIVVCASFIAAKFEEIDPPEVRDFVHMTQQACSKQSIVAMEVKMLTALEFCLCRPTAAHFLERYHRANGCSEVQRFILQYALELALLDLKMAKYSPSQQVAAALIISTGLAQELPVWPSGITDETRCESMCGPSPVVDCAREMCRLIQAAERSPYQAVRKKFLRPEYHSVAALLLT